MNAFKPVKEEIYFFINLGNPSHLLPNGLNAVREMHSCNVKVIHLDPCFISLIHFHL